MAAENIYYLKDGSLYKFQYERMIEVSVEEVLNNNNKPELIIDDKYFFYVGMEDVAVSGKKLKAIVTNYLNILFPPEMITEFGIFHHSGKTIIYIYNKELLDIISENKQLFSHFKKISTAFLEFSIKYNDFIFSDGVKLYKLSENMVTMYNDKESDFITVNDYFETASLLKYSLSVPGIQKVTALKMQYTLPIAALAIIYISLIITSVSEILSYSKINKSYMNQLNAVYAKAGVQNSKDPYGTLLSQTKRIIGPSNSKKTIEVFNELNAIDVPGVVLSQINIRDNSIVVEGTAENFSQVDSVKKAMEKELSTIIDLDDTKKTKDGISFVMKYQKAKK